jgi:hypothetical protein
MSGAVTRCRPPALIPHFVRNDTPEGGRHGRGGDHAGKWRQEGTGALRGRYGGRERARPYPQMNLCGAQRREDLAPVLAGTGGGEGVADTWLQILARLAPRKD